MRILSHLLTQKFKLQSFVRVFIEAIQAVLAQKRYSFLLLLFAIGFFFLFLFIPTRAIPGNSFWFQLSLLSFKEYILLGSLAFLSALSLTMQWYLWVRKRELRNAVSALGTGGAGGLSAVLASMFGTASCASCISAIFGFLGIGMVFTLIDYRNYIISASLLLILASIYFASRRINNICRSCDLQ